MTATPETVNSNDTQHHFLEGLAQQGDYAFAFAKAGHQKEALEHVEAIERLTAAYRMALDPRPSADTLPQWLYQRFIRNWPHALAWDALSDDDRTYWAHEAAAVRRAVARGGFKAGESE